MLRRKQYQINGNISLNPLVKFDKLFLTAGGKLLNFLHDSTKLGLSKNASFNASSKFSCHAGARITNAGCTHHADQHPYFS